MKQNSFTLLKRKARKIASNLVFDLKIPLGSNLVYFLEQPSANDNQEAISMWVIEQTEYFNLENHEYYKLKIKPTT